MHGQGDFQDLSLKTPPTPAVVCRSLTYQDLGEVFRLAEDRPGFGSRLKMIASRSAHIKLWSDVLRRKAVLGGLAELAAPIEDGRVLVFGLVGFVRRNWARNFLERPFPFVGLYILERLLAGTDDILLNDTEVRDANSSDGLHAVVMLSGWKFHTGRPSFELKVASMEAFLHTCRGFRLKEFISEVSDGPEAEFALSNHAWRERKRFQDPYPCAASPGIVIIGINSSEVREPQRETSVLASLFVWREILFGFTPDQQALLLLAMEQLPDREIAQRLGVGADAIGRRLDRIYRRVAARQHTLNQVFPEGVDNSLKRRLLIDYLNRNFHELRPHNFHLVKTVQNDRRANYLSEV
jgi:hypothetical protein